MAKQQDVKNPELNGYEIAHREHPQTRQKLVLCVRLLMPLLAFAGLIASLGYIFYRAWKVVQSKQQSFVPWVVIICELCFASMSRFLNIVSVAYIDDCSPSSGRLPWYTISRTEVYRPSNFPAALRRYRPNSGHIHHLLRRGRQPSQRHTTSSLLPGLPTRQIQDIHPRRQIMQTHPSPSVRYPATLHQRPLRQPRRERINALQSRKPQLRPL